MPCVLLLLVKATLAADIPRDSHRMIRTTTSLLPQVCISAAYLYQCQLCVTNGFAPQIILTTRPALRPLTPSNHKTLPLLSTSPAQKSLPTVLEVNPNSSRRRRRSSSNNTLPQETTHPAWDRPPASNLHQ
jgi:hypothetical protein